MSAVECNWPRCHRSPNPCFAWCKCRCHKKPLPHRVKISPDQHERLEALVVASQESLMTVETLVAVALEAFLEGAEGKELS